MKIVWTTSELKELVLVWLAFAWGVILIFPGNTFVPASRLDSLGLYAEDWVWGTVLVVVSLPMLLARQPPLSGYRRFAHAFYWIFWMGIGVLAAVRSSANGIQETDLLLVLPFFALAFLHGIIYAGLGRRL